MILCLGPVGSGKTLLLRKLQNVNYVDNTTSSVPTVGTNITHIVIGEKQFSIRELGGDMAPIWHKYYSGVKKVIYVVDTSNLCQISAAGVLLYTSLAHPDLKNAKVSTTHIQADFYCLKILQFLLVLAKMDVSYRQMRNEALLILQMKRLQKEIPQDLQVIEASAITGVGRDQILKWIKQ